MLKRWICLVLVLICLVPAAALAEKTYNSTKIYNEEIPTGDIIFKSGDRLTGGSRITVDITYVDANDKVVDRGNGTVKSVVIDGEKVTEWKLTERGGAIIQVGNMIYSAAYGFTMKPTYAVADDAGYFSLMDKTYHLYAENAANKKVKFTGTVINREGGTLYVSIAENAIVALQAEEDFAAGDRLMCKGTISEYTDYAGGKVPMIACDEVMLRQYEPLQKGDAGEEVMQMKVRLQELGYFRAGAELSDAYNDTCVERVQMFQKNNGLPATGAADVETLTLLYSDAAKAN